LIFEIFLKLKTILFIKKIFFSLNLADIRGYLQEGLLNWMLDYTDLVRKITGGTLNEVC